MSNFSISVKNYEEEPVVIETTYGEQNIELEIICDGDVNNNSFAVNYDGDEGMTIQRNRCKLNIHLDRNYKNWERNYHIWLTHVNDEYVRVDINITQKNEIFSINASDQKLSSDYQEKGEIKPFTIDVNGGSKKFNIIEIAKIHFTENVENITVNDVKYEYNTFIEEENGEITYKWVNGDNTVYTSMRNPSKNNKTTTEHIITEVEYESVRQPFDNGFELLKEDNIITITSYGRPFLEENDYYEIILQHADDINVKQTITVKYNPLTKTENTETQETTARIEDTIDTPVEIPNTEVLEEEVIEVQPPVYKILFNEDLDNLVINNVERMVIPFRVTEDGKETNLMAAATASANWCLTEIEQRYNSAGRIVRNLIINIRNRPISERKSSVSVYIFDIPNVNVNFVLTNKPSF